MKLSGAPFREVKIQLTGVYNPDNRTFSPTALVPALHDGEVQVWDAATSEPIGWKMWHESWVNLAVFSPDGRRILTASGEDGKAGEARVWDAASGVPVTPPMKHEARVYSAEFSLDGRRVCDAGPGTLRPSGQ